MTTKVETQALPVKRRIRRLYGLLNRGEFKRCFEMIDPRIREMPTSVTFYQYESALAQFLKYHSSIAIESVELELHLDEPSSLYQNRDFAVGKTTWLDKAGNRHVFLERWVREGQSWHTRSTGFVAIAPPKKSSPVIRTPNRKINAT